MSPFTVRPIGFVRSPFVEKVEAPRQSIVAEGVEGRVEILREHEHALEDLDGFDRIWILFWFHEAGRASPLRVSRSASRYPKGYDGNRKSKVLPPRSGTKRGVFATRSPHRPNPIGMSAVRLVRADGLVLHVRDLDLIDGTPVLDLKPYLAYADAFPDARAGWLEEPRDPRPSWEVRVAEAAEAQLAWIAARGGDVRACVVKTLALGPRPHPYRRIKALADGGFVLAVKEWRARFVVDGRAVTVERITTGYRDRDLARGAEPIHELHRTFVATFG